MSFIDNIDTTPPRQPAVPSSPTSNENISTTTSNNSFLGNIDTSQPLVPVQNQVTNLLNPDRITGAIQSSLEGLVERSLDSLGNSVKTVLNEKIAKYATSPIKDALGKVAGGLLGDFFDGFMDEGQNIPPQYSGTTNVETFAEDYYHSDRYAEAKYNLKETSDAINDSHPMMKYMFVADFVFNTDEYYRTNMMQSFPTSLTLSLKNTTFPKMDIETEEVNQYNRHVVSGRRVRYQPITTTFGESVSHMAGSGSKASMIEVWEKIASYYINDLKNPDADYYHSPLGHKSGLSHNNLIKYIDYYFIWPSSTKRLRIVNPMITSFSYDNLDYSSDDQVLANFDIKYEYYQLTEVRGDFISFINSPVGVALAGGSPYELVNTGTARNIDTVNENAIGQHAPDIDDQRNVNLDNPYVQAALDAAEQEAISAAATLLGSSDPIKRELGRQAVQRSLDAGQTLAEATGVGSAVQDTIRDLGSAIGRPTIGYITGLF